MSQNRRPHSPKSVVRVKSVPMAQMTLRVQSSVSGHGIGECSDQRRRTQREERVAAQAPISVLGFEKRQGSRG